MTGKLPTEPEFAALSDEMVAMMYHAFRAFRVEEMEEGFEALGRELGTRFTKDDVQGSAGSSAPITTLRWPLSTILNPNILKALKQVSFADTSMRDTPPEQSNRTNLFHASKEDFLKFMRAEEGDRRAQPPTSDPAQQSIKVPAPHTPSQVQSPEDLPIEQQLGFWKAFLPIVQDPEEEAKLRKRIAQIEEQMRSREVPAQDNRGKVQGQKIAGRKAPKRVKFTPPDE